MNKIELVGRIATDIDLRYTENGKSVANFNIAVNRIGTEGADFIRVDVWDKQAENLKEYQNKGSLVAVEGSLRVSQYEDKDGNKRNMYSVVANNIEYLSSKKEQNNENVKESDPFAEFGEQVSIEDNLLD